MDRAKNNKEMQRKRKIFDEDPRIKVDTLQAPAAKYPRLLEVGEAKYVDIKTITDVSADINIQDVIAFAKLPLVTRRAALWGLWCTVCNKGFNEAHLLLCTSCRQFRYCSEECRVKHMEHSFDGCRAPAAFRISDKHRIRHVLTGDATALEASLPRPRSAVSLDSIMTFQLSERMLPLELAAFTGDVAVVQVLVNRTTQTALSTLGGRPVCARIALDHGHVDALVAMFVHEIRPSVAQVADIPAHTGSVITLTLLNAIKSKNFPGVVGLDETSEMASFAARMGDDQALIDQVSYPDLPTAFFSQRGDIIQLLWQLFKHRLPFIAPTIVEDLLEQYVYYRPFEDHQTDAIEHVLRCDKDHRKLMSITTLFALIGRETPELLRKCLEHGFFLERDVELKWPTTNAAFLPVLASYLPSDGWTCIPASFFDKPDANRHIKGHHIVSHMWDMYLTNREAKADCLQWLASQGAETDELHLRKLGLDVSQSRAVIFAGDSWRIDPHHLAGWNALESGFKEHLILVRQALYECVKQFPPDIIDSIIMKYLVQHELINLIQVIKVQLQAGADHRNQEISGYVRVRAGECVDWL